MRCEPRYNARGTTSFPTCSMLSQYDLVPRQREFWDNLDPSNPHVLGALIDCILIIISLTVYKFL